MSNVPRPPYMEYYQARINAIAGVNCAEMFRLICGTAWHTEVGTFLGTKQHFTNPQNGALTDYQIGCSFDGQYNGVIMRFIEPDMGVAPYANGKIDDCVLAFDEGKRFIDFYVRPTGNLEELNARARSIECADNGNPDIDRSTEHVQMESLAFLTAYTHNVEAKQTGAQFLANTHGEQFLHYQTGACHTKCPGWWLKENKQKVRNRAAQIILAYESDTALTTPLVVTYPPGWTGPLIKQPGSTTVDYAKPDTRLIEALADKHCMNISGAIVVRFRDWVKFDKPIRPNQYAFKGSPAIGPDETNSIHVVSIIEKGNGEKWAVGIDSARYLMTGNTVTVL